VIYCSQVRKPMPRGPKGILTLRGKYYSSIGKSAGGQRLHREERQSPGTLRADGHEFLKERARGGVAEGCNGGRPMLRRTARSMKKDRDEGIPRCSGERRQNHRDPRSQTFKRLKSLLSGWGEKGGWGDAHPPKKKRLEKEARLPPRSASAAKTGTTRMLNRKRTTRAGVG